MPRKPHASFFPFMMEEVGKNKGVDGGLRGRQRSSWAFLAGWARLTTPSGYYFFRGFPGLPPS